MRILLLAAALLGLSAPARALDDIAAFERGFAVSLWQFDACGDGLAGRIFRQALAERMAHCPFSAEARERYRTRTRAEFRKARERMTEMVEARGGLPDRLEGMGGTCRALQDSAPYREFRALLERYSEGGVPAEAVIPAACDAPDILP
ncbi:hypothetical protein [Paracraurococcus ruber]|uniref:Uncharacterized protein n=1 Tax=Paracraurococcus ruber TaxID=77675 RepID=A0ABS1D6A8_9PROT|nr:hypothetical protein [Paracraurococcus ruber]MBK1662349.1 hypothetical protein [Paracraurococcus ruber]TDG20289.1 hypothetical protein E2C05_27210 [Paracraurococcus ruber]